MVDIYEARRESLEQYLKHIRIQPNQVGLACAIDGNTAGIELFEDTSVFHQFFDKLVRAYAAEVVFESVSQRWCRTRKHFISCFTKSHM